MTEIHDPHAHARIDKLEKSVEGLYEEHRELKSALDRNTDLTQQIADNTSEIVSLVKGFKGLRTLIVWLSPVVVAWVAFTQYLQGK